MQMQNAKCKSADGVSQFYSADVQARAQTCPAVCCNKELFKGRGCFLVRPTCQEMFLNANQIGGLDHFIRILF